MDGYSGQILEMSHLVGNAQYTIARMPSKVEIMRAPNFQQLEQRLFAHRGNSIAATYQSPGRHLSPITNLTQVQHRPKLPAAESKPTLICRGQDQLLILNLLNMIQFMCPSKTCLVYTVASEEQERRKTSNVRLQYMYFHK